MTDLQICVLGDMTDITAPKAVQIQIRPDGKTFWVNANGICVLRCCQIEELDIEDGRPGTMMRDANLELPEQRIRVQGWDGSLSHDCFYGCGTLSIRGWYTPDSEKICWRTTHDEKPVSANDPITHWTPLFNFRENLGASASETKLLVGRDLCPKCNNLWENCGCHLPGTTHTFYEGKCTMCGFQQGNLIDPYIACNCDFNEGHEPHCAVVKAHDAELQK